MSIFPKIKSGDLSDYLFSLYSQLDMLVPCCDESVQQSIRELADACYELSKSV